MTGRTGLTWVTALTIASLMLGGGALNALADGHGGGGGKGGGGRGGAVQQQQQQQQQPQKPVVVHHGDDAPVTQIRHDDVKHDDTPSGNADKGDDHGNRGPNLDRDRRDNNEDRRDDDDDLVTPPARVTDEDRPGLGCGDENHEHSGPPGNPDKECKHRGDNGDDDDAAISVDASANTVIAATNDDN